MLTYSGSQTHQASPFPDSSVCPACLCQRCQGLWQNPSILAKNLVAMSSRDFQQTFQWWIWDSTDSLKIYKYNMCFKDSWINSNNHFHNHFPETILSLCFHHRSEHPWPFWIDALRASSHFPGSLSTLSVEIPGELHEMDALDVRASMEVFETLISFILH